MSSIASTALSKRTYKIVLLGNEGVGKTSMINRFCHNKFDDQSNPTIGIDFVGKNITHEGVGYRLQLWDTAGQERYRSLIPTYLKDALCSIFIYDSTNGQTLESIQSWIQLFKENKTDKSILILCGNKIDLLLNHQKADKKSSKIDEKQEQQLKKTENDEKQDTQQKKQKQTRNNAKSKPLPSPQTLKFLIKKYQLKHFEVSAATGLNVNEMFHSIIESIAGEQERKKKKFADEYDLPISSTSLFQVNMTSDMTENQPDSVRLQMDVPMSPGKKRRKKKLRQNEQAEQMEGLQGEGTISFWKRCCKFCGS